MASREKVFGFKDIHYENTDLEKQIIKLNKQSELFIKGLQILDRDIKIIKTFVIILFTSFILHLIIYLI